MEALDAEPDDMTTITDPVRHTSTDLEAFWMPFTANRQFKSKPRMMTPYSTVMTLPQRRAASRISSVSSG